VLVALGLNQHIENLALGVDGAPQIDHPPIDLQIDFVKMPYVDAQLIVGLYRTVADYPNRLYLLTSPLIAE
jgi:hypothetical protein